jgi:hypothetical protein
MLENDVINLFLLPYYVSMCHVDQNVRFLHKKTHFCAKIGCKRPLSLKKQRFFGGKKDIFHRGKDLQCLNESSQVEVHLP